MISIIFRLFLLILSYNLTLNAKELEKVSLQLQWLDQFQFAGYYMAKEKGFYKEAGLDVDIRKYKSSINALEEVINGNTTFGIGRSTLIMRKVNGAKIKLIASIFQSSPMILIALKNSNIKDIKDIFGKRIMITKDAAFTISLEAMARKNGLRLRDQQIIERTFSIDDLIENRTDLISGYISNEPFRLQERGYEYLIFDPKNYGFDFYSDILFTSDEVVQNKPRVVQRMKEASLRGWKYAFNHIQESAELIYKKYNVQNKSLKSLIYEGKTLKKLAYFKTKELGAIDKNKIQRIYDIYNVLGYVNAPLNMNELIFKPTYVSLKLNLAEERFIQKTQPIKVCAIPDAMPLSKIKGDELIGMSAEYLKLISQKTSLKFTLVPTSTWKESLEFIKNNKCDMLPIVQETPSRKKFLNFTNSYIKSKIIIATKKDKIFINHFENILDKTFSIKQSYSFVEILKLRYPYIKLKIVDTTENGLKMVKDGEVYGYIGELYSTAYLVGQKYSKSLKISGNIDKEIDVKMAVSKEQPMLLNILNKFISTITTDEINNILNAYLSVSFLKETDYKLVFQLLIGFFIILLIVTYFVIKLKKHKDELKQSKEQFHQYINLMQDSFAVMNMNTTQIVFCNKAFENMTGYTLDQLQQIPISKIYPKNTLSYIIAQLNEAKGKKNSIISNIPLLHKNGDSRVFDVDISIVQINKESFYFASFRNLSDKIESESKLREENKQLREKLKQYE